MTSVTFRNGSFSLAIRISSGSFVGSASLQRLNARSSPSLFEILLPAKVYVIPEDELSITNVADRDCRSSSVADSTGSTKRKLMMNVANCALVNDIPLGDNLGGIPSGMLELPKLRSSGSVNPLIVRMNS